jgi:ribosomal protein S18 acetylase RimI-like enzyme
MVVRPYQAGDRDAVRRLCCDTGFLGNPIDPVFEDRELFADFLTRYYTDHEPESAFVLEKDGAVKGYLLGSRRRFKLGLATLGDTLANVFKLLRRYPGYNAAGKRYVHWILLKGWRETPPAPDNAAHFHINILPEARTMEKTRELFNAFFSYLVEQGENRVYGQMVTWDERRTEALFRRYGFQVLNKREITKYRKFTEDRVFLTTCLRELDSTDQDRRGSIRTRRHGIHGQGKRKGLPGRRGTKQDQNQDQEK